MDQREAERKLITFRRVMVGRDELVRGAYAAGLQRMQIHRLSGLSRRTVDRIIAGQTPERR